ncbi:PRC-barrel domain-containing protein [Kitasatospora camelliae]|uniref:PRC-barrel domain-containing protein n=1 Tax=Kitasatospora camelliae TaxID=3156397 RepID=A0AAU8JR55_9ACTN
MSRHVDVRESRSTVGRSAGTDLIGFHVVAADGPIGTVDRLSGHVGTRYLVVDTGPWIFGRRVLLPAGTVVRIEHGEHTVYIDRSRDEIRHSPAYAKGPVQARPEHRAPVTLSYSPFSSGRII